MKFGIHLSVFTENWADDLEQYILKSKEIGYDGVEIPLMDPFGLDIKRLIKILEDNQILCTCGTGLSDQTDISSEDLVVRRNGINHLKKCIDICQQLSCDVLGGVLYSPWGKLYSRKDSEVRIECAIECLQEVGLYAKEKGVILALESINRYETYMLNTIQDGLDFIKRVGSEYVKIHFDTYHGNIEEKSIPDAIRSAKGEIYHVHFSENDRGIPGSGSIQWTKIKDALIDINYDRWVVLECFVKPDCETGTGTNTWRKIEVNADKTAQEGLKFMKDLFGLDHQLTKEQCKELLKRISRMFDERQDELSMYDSVIGDGDHGITMAKGAKAAIDKINQTENFEASELFKLYGKTLISTLGGAIGPLYGSIFIELSLVMKNKINVGLVEFATGFDQALNKVIELGGAKPGDKTMVDSMVPTVYSLLQAVAEQKNIVQAFEEAKANAIIGAYNTIPMIAKRGRSRYLQEKAIGYQDAGATSFAYMIEQIYIYLLEVSQ
ncbi:MAG: dihydroxyacetone kinase subunit DhaL [Erysipelotrichaceae bacterium]|nr:dihydroxyacetone kinase subunit DhaL [Erysipelotrichaceae bacterium]MDP3305825.1 dihydroxyacetone kinase subunit DhaL [Erysipelotrichaceae bacterium]